MSLHSLWNHKDATPFFKFALICYGAQFFASALVKALLPTWDAAARLPVNALLHVLGQLPMIVSIWRTPKASGYFLKGIATIFSLYLPISLSLFVHRIEVLVNTIVFVCMFVVWLICLRIYYKYKSKPLALHIFEIDLIFLMLFLAVYASDYTFINDSFLPLWQIPLPIGILVGFVITRLFFWKETGLWGRIGYTLVFSLIAFILALIVAVHMNYALDAREPQPLSVTIVDKEYQHRRKRADSYHFEFIIDGKEHRMDVSSSEYKRYEIGDTYLIDRYEGAFGEPFYIVRYKK